MFKKMKSTFYMEQLTAIERYLKEGFQLKKNNAILVWFSKVDENGVTISYGIFNKFIDEGISTYSLALQLDEHFKKTRSSQSYRVVS